MGILDDLMGKSSARSAELAADTQGRANARGGQRFRENVNAGYDTADGYLQPFAQQGQRGYDLYADSIGVNGAGGYGRAFDTFNADPFRAGMQDAAGREVDRLFRRYNPTGQTGASQLAVSRATSDRYAQDVGDFRNRLMGFGGQGLQVAGQRAGMAVNRGQQIGGSWQQQMTNAGNIAAGGIMNASNARTAGTNNLFKGLGAVGGMALSAFTPGAGGVSAAGNIASAFKGLGGSNALMQGYGTPGWGQLEAF
jgi:hypothetical protein